MNVSLAGVTAGDAGETETADEPQPIAIEGGFATGIPAGIKPGTPLDAVFAINIAGLLLEPGKRYEWRLSIDGRTEDDWYLAFNTRPASGPTAIAA